MEKVILVDENDNELGSIEKMEAHKKGLLHRAFSVFIVNQEGKILLQQRELSKYHSGGLWTNTCCSHPKPHETLEEAGARRLYEEMGFTTSVKPHFSFIYNVALDGGLAEHELDHVLVGYFSGTIQPNPNEVMDYKWVDLDDLIQDCQLQPERYTAWLQIILSDYATSLKQALQL